MAIGTTTAVFRGTEEATGEIVALKAMNKDSIGSPKDLRRLNREFQIAHCLSHPNIVKTFPVIHTKDLAVLAMEHCLSTVLDWRSTACSTRLCRSSKFSGRPQARFGISTEWEWRAGI
jgi:serine/threonine protein kinase